MDALQNRINKCIGNCLNGMKLFHDNMTNDKFEKSIKENTDSYVATLKQEFSGYNPFSWEDI